jgi:hypothetical protein
MDGSLSATTPVPKSTPEGTGSSTLRVPVAQLDQLLSGPKQLGRSLSVEQQITPLETQIEQLQGQQQVLENRAQYGMLSVDLSEAPPKPAPKPAPVTTSGLSRAWAHARHSFTHGMESVVSATGGIAVFALCAIVVGVLGRLGWRVLRRRLV